MNLQQIVNELRNERDRIDRAISSLQVGLSDGRRRRGRPAKLTKPAGGITAAGRKRLSEAMKRRWAERRRKGAKAATSSISKPTKKRGGITAAGRKRLSEMMKKRWAERRKKAS